MLIEGFSMARTLKYDSRLALTAQYIPKPLNGTRAANEDTLTIQRSFSLNSFRNDDVSIVAE